MAMNFQGVVSNDRNRILNILRGSDTALTCGEVFASFDSIGDRLLAGLVQNTYLGKINTCETLFAVSDLDVKILTNEPIRIDPLIGSIDQISVKRKTIIDTFVGSPSRIKV